LIRLNKKLLLPEYLNQLLNSEYAFRQYDPMKKEVARANLSLTNIADLKIPTPDIEEQKKIVAEFEKLETEIAQIESELATMDEQKEQILKKHLE